MEEATLRAFTIVSRYLTGAVVLSSVFLVVYAGYKYIGARDDPQRVGNARAILINTMIACAIAVGGFSLVNLTLSALTSSPAAIQITNLLETPDSMLVPPKVTYFKYNGQRQNGIITLIFDQEVCYNAQELNHISIGTSAGKMPLLSNYRGRNAASCAEGNPNRDPNEIEFTGSVTSNTMFNTLVFEYGSSIVSIENNMTYSAKFSSFLINPDSPEWQPIPINPDSPEWQPIN